MSADSEQFAYMWQYRVHPSRRREFLAAYRPGGSWTRLFSTDPTYIDTILIQDVSDENRFVTIDFWRSAADRDAFRERCREAFDELDAACELLTIDETFLGDFSQVGASATGQGPGFGQA